MVWSAAGGLKGVAGGHSSRHDAALLRLRAPHAVWTPTRAAGGGDLAFARPLRAVVSSKWRSEEHAHRLIRCYAMQPSRAINRVCSVAWLLLAAVCGSGCAEPEATIAAPKVESCSAAACHADVEQIHYGGQMLRCVDCHGGNPEAPTKAGAHVTVDYSFNPTTPGKHFLDDPPLVDLAAVPTAVMQFLNPADYRVIRNTCGSSTLAGGNCHSIITSNSLLLNRATLAGQLAGGGFIAGVQGKAAHYGVVPTRDTLTPTKLPPLTAADFPALPADVPASVTPTTAQAFYPVYEQLCTECHLSREGAKMPGRYYSAGCNGCHMTTADDGRTVSSDPTQNREEIGHPMRHRFTNLVPDRQCAHCHISHLGRALLAQGVRERSEPDGDKLAGGPNRGAADPPNAVPWAKENYIKYKGMYWQYGKPYPYFIADENGTNDTDETPPDIHTAKGLACIDCHNIVEEHGTGKMAYRMDQELDVRCQSCHGRPGEKAKLMSDSAVTFDKAGTAAGGFGGNPLMIHTLADGTVYETGKIDGKDHPVTQINARIDPAGKIYNPRTRMGCQLHAGSAEARAAVRKAVNDLSAKDPAAVAKEFPGLPEGFKFKELGGEEDGRVECFTCHNSWTLNCYGCHMVRDDRKSYVSRIDGKKKLGAVESFGLSVLPDALAMGFNARGRISPLVGTSIFFTHIDKGGNKVIDAQALTTGEGLTGEGNVHNPVHHHTIQKLPRDCTGCHPAATGDTSPQSANAKAVLRAVGLGTGEATFVDGNGKTHWLDRLLWADYDGDGKWDDPKTLGLPQALAAVERAVGTTHLQLPSFVGLPDPGPLDLATVRRVIDNRVVNQRP